MVTYEQGLEIQKLYNTGLRKYTTTKLAGLFNISPARVYQIVAGTKPVVPTTKDRKKFGIKLKKPNKYIARVVRGNQVYYLMSKGRVWSMTYQCYVNNITLTPPPKIKDVRRKKVELKGKTYFIYENGKVWSCSRARFVSGSLNKGTYAVEATKISRLLLTLFVREPKEDEVARHLDGDGSHTWLSNLKWGTRQDNVNDQIVYGSEKRGKRASNACMTEHVAQAIIDEWESNQRRYESMNDYAKEKATETGLTPTSMYNLLTGATWKHLNRTTIVAHKQR